MKIPASIREIYEARKPVFDRLKEDVDKRIIGFKDSRWHYESRVKAPESFTLKLETGRFPDPSALEDFFGCTIVVPNLSGIDAAEAMVGQQFSVQDRRPKVKGQTHKAPDSFPFDDVRLYVAIAEDPRYPPSGLENLRFEVQIKTFLQHAWSIATHDLIYKSASVSWPQERIAYQVKAMLEHAELSIEEAASLSKSNMIAKTDRKIQRIGEAIKIIVEVWKGDAPSDIKRLASNVVDVCDAVSISLPTMKTALSNYIADRGGTPPENVSPYLAIIEALCDKHEDKMARYLCERPTKDSKLLLLTKETSLPASFPIDKVKRAVVMK